MKNPHIKVLCDDDAEQEAREEAFDALVREVRGGDYVLARQLLDLCCGRSEFAGVRANAWQILSMVGIKDQVVSEMIESSTGALMEDPEPFVRITVIACLHHFSRRVIDAVRERIDRLAKSDPDQHVRCAARSWQTREKRRA